MQSASQIVTSNHQQTNTQCFTGRMFFLSPNQQCQSTEGTDRLITGHNKLIICFQKIQFHILTQNKSSESLV